MDFIENSEEILEREKNIVAAGVAEVLENMF